jgi:hypothetical protein
MLLTKSGSRAIDHPDGPSGYEQQRIDFALTVLSTMSM